MFKQLATLCVFAFVFTSAVKATEPSVFIKYQIAKRSGNKLQAKLSLTEPHYNKAHSFWFLDWKEGHGIVVRKVYGQEQVMLYVDFEKALKRDSRCVIHTNYDDQLNGQSFKINRTDNYQVIDLAQNVKRGKMDQFVLSFADNTQPNTTAFQVSCVGMDVFSTTLEDIVLDLNQRIDFY
jgi:hypothetical protein